MNNDSSRRSNWLGVLLLGFVVGCQQMPPITTVPQLDTERFMGKWYVVAHIPPFLVNDAYNSVENYRLTKEGSVDVLYTFNKASFDGELKVMRPTAFPKQGELDGQWTIQFLWPFKVDYRVSYVSEEYDTTIIGRQRRDYAWVMAREPIIDDATYQQLINKLVALGYERSKVRKVPQQALGQRIQHDVIKEFEANQVLR